MAPPIGIRYYNCRNAGVGIIIWPQLRGVSPNMILWDAPSGGLDKLYISKPNACLPARQMTLVFIHSSWTLTHQ